MFAFRFKNKIKNIEHLVYLDQINNSLAYHGITISDNNITALNKNILNEMYDLFKINDKCTFIKNNGNYDIYYDYNNDLYHYIKDNISIRFRPCRFHHQIPNKRYPQRNHHIF